MDALIAGGGYSKMKKPAPKPVVPMIARHEHAIRRLKTRNREREASATLMPHISADRSVPLSALSGKGDPRMNLRSCRRCLQRRAIGVEKSDDRLKARPSGH